MTRALTGARRSTHARHELRFGTRELTVAALAVLVVCGLAFAGGLFLGREMGPARGGRAEDRRAAAVPGAGRPAAALPDADDDATGSKSRLTFYKTLTAPTVESAAPAPPIVEERLILKTTPPPPPGPSPTVTARAELPRRPRSPAPPAPPVAAVAARAPAAGGAEPQLWTIQVSSFRTRALADDLRARLATLGFDAYLVSVATEDGRVRYRVRVGTFDSRPEAERVAGELRGERNLSPFVTPKSR